MSPFQARSSSGKLILLLYTHTQVAEEFVDGGGFIDVVFDGADGQGDQGDDQLLGMARTSKELLRKRQRGRGHGIRSPIHAYEVKVVRVTGVL